MNGPVEGKNNRPMEVCELDWNQCAVMTIHGSQGLEFKYGEVDMQTMFDWHMALVAFTRFFDSNNIRVTGGIVEWLEFRVHPKLLDALRVNDALNVEAVCALYARMAAE